MLKYSLQISSVGKDLNLNLGLKNKIGFSGFDNDTENLIFDQTNENINDVADGEKTRFMPSTGRTITFSFWSGSTFVNKISPLEFNNSYIGSSQIINSFYVCQIYDSPIQDKQLLLHTSYINGYTFSNTLNSVYNWSKINEYCDIHILNSFLDNLTATTVNLYFKFSFYSGKSGKVFPFYNLSSTSIAEDKLYYVSNFNLSTKIYNLTTNFSLREVTNNQYVTLINDSVTSNNIEKPVYMSGTTFTTTGQYI